ncbi:unnamed protein product [Durusdinium trenchii]|uniref:Uncharacterized protein n=1 Tax=Durusdinium trenchii TaxID=1381693 RepID=A0ABP0K3R5_9DINO
MATDVLEVLEDAIALDEIQAASEEQQLEWHAAYREYVSLMEERILSACAEDLTKEEVLVQLTSLLENDEDDRRHARFLLR